MNRNTPSPGAIKCSRIIVTNVALQTTEDTGRPTPTLSTSQLIHAAMHYVVRDFFAFCGEISMLHLYST